MRWFLLSLVIFSNISLGQCQNEPETVESLVSPCEEVLQKDDLTAAGKCWQDVVNRNILRAKEINDFVASKLFKKCVEIKERRDYKKAIVCFEGAKELMPDSANVRFNLADSYFEFSESLSYHDTELLEDAENAVREGLEIRTDDRAAVSLYARILRRNSKFQDALVQYEKLIKIDPNATTYWTGFGLTQQKLERYEESVTSLKKAISLDPENAPAYYFLAVSYEKLDEMPLAIETLKKLLQLQPDNKDAKDMLKRINSIKR